MKNSIYALIGLVIIIASTLLSCNKDTNINTTPVVITNNSCYTVLISESIAKAVVAKEDYVRTGQFVNGVIKDHAKKFPGYTKEMFFVDNPAIALRKPVKKLDPCDSTKVKYVSIPLHVGDWILLRLPLKLDTISGDQESIVWKSPLQSGNIKHVVDMDDQGRCLVSDQNIRCENQVPVIIPAQPTASSLEFENSDGFWSHIPYWAWLIIGIMLLSLLIGSIQHSRTRRFVKERTDENSILATLIKSNTTIIKDHIDQEYEKTRIIIDEKVNKMVGEQKTTNDLLEKILKQGGLSGEKKGDETDKNK